MIYCIIGGIAVSLMGEIRTTKDIDFIILLEENQKESIILKLISFRKQDELDIENIIKSDETIDWRYLEEQTDRMKLNRDFIEDLKKTLGE
jgi:hypothetical protein